jgi:hypothetical protein
VVLGAAVGAGGAIPASSGGRFGRGRAWGGSGVALGRCERLDRAEMRPAEACVVRGMVDGRFLV